MNILLATVLLSTLSLRTHCLDAPNHRHRHSRSHPQEYNFDRLMNRLDAQTSPKVAETTTKSTATNTFNELSEHLSGSNPNPGNSLWDDDDSGDYNRARSSLDDKWWQDAAKTDKVDTEKRREEEDAEDDLDEQAEDNDEGMDDQEQADSYKLWNPRGGESYSNWKWDNMGSRKSVDNLFQVFRSGQLRPDAGAKEAAENFELYRHTKLMAKETLCRWPRPKVVRVADLYGSTSKMYVPACTVLHQCGDDTGCCSGTGQRCGPKTTKRVELYFYTTYIMANQNHQRTTNGVEKLPFYNHTECECVDRLEDVMPRDGGPSPDFRNERTPDQGCKCPSEYTVRRLSNGSCSCDCFDKQRDCIKYKRGKEYFNHNDRLCIEMGTCQQPSCDFGVYLRNFGRCPRKHEKFRSWSRHHH